MGSPVANEQQKNTYKDYLGWPEGERWEIIEGIAYNMCPAPTPKHQLILGALYMVFGNYFKGKPCTVYLAPFDVRLSEPGTEDGDIENVVQPDLSVICDKNKVDERGANGAPDLLVEITSPSTASKDMKQKMSLYEKYGVKEYWIVHPSENIVEIFRMNDHGMYGKPDVYADDDKIEVRLFPGLTVELKEVF